MHLCSLILLFLLPLNMLTLKMHNYFRKTISRTEIQKPDSKNRNGNNKTKQHKPSSFWLCHFYNKIKANHVII